jgi:hypothetical protein
VNPIRRVLSYLRPSPVEVSQEDAFIDELSTTDTDPSERLAFLLAVASENLKWVS